MDTIHNEKQLILNKPMVSFIPEDNFIFSIIGENDPVFYEYLFDNYIQISYFYEYDNLISRFYDSIYVNFSKNKCLSYLFLPKNILSILKQDIVESIIYLIENNYYISVNIDRFYIKEYGSINHGSHILMIYGYSRNNNLFYIRDFFKGTYRTGICNFDELRNAIMNYKLTNEYYFYDGITAIKKRDNYLGKININLFVTQLYSLVNSKFDIKTVSTGFSWFDAINYMLTDNFINLDVSSLAMNTFFLSQHITLMRKRVLYLSSINPIEQFIELEKSFNEIMKNATIIKNKCIKIKIKNREKFNKIERDYLIDEFKKIKDGYLSIINNFIEIIDVVYGS